MGFESCHPFVIFIYYLIVFICAASFNHPVFAGISFLMACLHFVATEGKRGIMPFFCIILLIPIYTFFYSMQNHFGATPLWTSFTGNPVCLESVFCGFTGALRMAAILLQLFCFGRDFSSDKLLYISGRVSPGLSMYLAVLFRNMSLIRLRLGQVIRAREGIGSGEKPIRASLIATKNISIESLFTMSASMRSRGQGLRGRMAFSIYRYSDRDRGLSLIISLLAAIIFSACLLDQCRILYDPFIEMNPVTPFSHLFYVTYALFLAVPMLSHKLALSY